MFKTSQKVTLFIVGLVVIGGGAGAIAYAQYFKPSLLPGAAAVQQEEQKQLAPVISAEELHDKVIKKELFLLVDVRSKESYDAEHAQGAINIPFKEIESHLNQLMPFDRDIVTMCNGDECELSTKAATKLLELGFTNVKNYDGGIAGWKIKGYPTVSGTVSGK